MTGLVVTAFALTPCAAAVSETTPEHPAIEVSGVLEAMEIGGVDARTGTLLLSGQEGGDVDGALLWTLGPATDAGQLEVPFVVEVEGLALVSGLEEDRIAIALLAYVVDNGGRIVDHIAQGIILDAGNYTDRLMATGLKFVGRTSLAPGIYTLRVMVREQSTGHFFMARSRLDVPTNEDSSQTLMPPVFRDQVETWVIVRQNGKSETFVLGSSGPGIPAARPVLVEGRPSEFFVGGVLEDSADGIEASLIDPAGRVVAEYPIEVSDPAPPTARLRSATLPAMDLPPGRYNLVLSTRSADNGPGTRRSTPVVLVASGDPPTWVGRSPPRSAATTGGEPSGGRRKFRRDKIREAYLDALTDLASGNSMGARQRVADLERHAMRLDVLRGLRRIEDGVAAELAELDPNCLLPIALLHQQMVRRYVARRKFVLAAHSRTVTADRAAQIGKAHVGNGFAEAVLVGLASDLSRMASGSLAREYLEHALLLDPEFRPALLALGASFERGADYSQAARVFEELVESDPGNDEGRLRLAVNLARSGNERAAEQSFRKLIRGRPDDWIAVLAAQELARLMIESNHPDEALAVVERSIRRYPGDQRLRVLEAWVLDSTGRSLDAVEALLAIPPAEKENSPRLRYGEWPELGSEVSATTIRATAETALPTLGTALESLGPSS